ncbi:MAG TPA: NfeD family protein [Leptolyngbyaceae cyanobacterium M65_K2018_010]|nr:NfeD family protein [Leptolyngbyaceae cyanobacterium M65_K2018_010]
MDLTHTIKLFKDLKPARVEHRITFYQRGRVFFEGTSWPAKIYDLGDLELTDFVVDVASRVMVVGRQGLTLLVLPSVSNTDALGKLDLPGVA